MKNLEILLLAVLSLCLFSCKEPAQPDNPDKPYLNVPGTEISVEAEACVVYSGFEASGTVVANTKASWLSASIVAQAGTDGEVRGEGTGFLRLAIDENTGRNERSATVTLSSPFLSDVAVTVTQAAAGLPKSSTCDLISFKVGVQDGLDRAITFSFNKTERTLTGKHLVWIEKENAEMLVPTFSHNGVKVLVDGAEIISGETAISFAEDFTLEVVAENGALQSYSVSLNCPQINTELPVLRLQPASEITSKEVYVKTAVTLYSPHTKSGWWKPEDGEVDVRGRGNSTWGLPKKPYRIKFPVKFSPIGLEHAKEKSWVILAHDMDKSLIRNHIAFQISKVMFNSAEGYHDPSAIMFTPCSQYINVYMNNAYHGVYQMSDQMERAKGRIEVEKLEALSGSDPEIISGGHIIETDIHGASAPERFNSATKRIQMNHKYPKDDDHDPAQYAYMENFVASAETALYGSNYKDRENGWRKYLDEKTMADFIIVKEFVGDMDGYTSTYFYKRRGVDKIFFGPIWDCDKGWDNDKRTANGISDKANNLMIHAGFLMPAYVSNDWFQRVWTDETFRAFVAARWAAKRSELIATVERVLDSQPASMKKAIEANFTKWQFYYQASTEANMPAATYEAEIERIRTLTHSRAEALDRLFNK